MCWVEVTRTTAHFQSQGSCWRMVPTILTPVCTLDLIKVRHSSPRTAVNTVQYTFKMGRDWLRPVKIWANARHWCLCTGACRRGARQRGRGQQRAWYKSDTVVWAKSCCQNNYSNVTFTPVSFPMWTPCFEKKSSLKSEDTVDTGGDPTFLCFMLLNYCSHLAAGCAMKILPRNCSTSETVAIVIDSHRQIRQKCNINKILTLIPFLFLYYLLMLLTATFISNSAVIVAPQDGDKMLIGFVYMTKIMAVDYQLLDLIIHISSFKDLSSTCMITLSYSVVSQGHCEHRINNKR